MCGVDACLAHIFPENGWNPNPTVPLSLHTPMNWPVSSILLESIVIDHRQLPGGSRLPQAQELPDRSERTVLPRFVISTFSESSSTHCRRRESSVVVHSCASRPCSRLQLARALKMVGRCVSSAQAPTTSRSSSGSVSTSVAWSPGSLAWPLARSSACPHAWSPSSVSVARLRLVDILQETW